MLRTSRETLLRRTDELRVSLVVSEHDEAVDTRVLRCTDGVVDPLLERLKQASGSNDGKTFRSNRSAIFGRCRLHPQKRTCAVRPTVSLSPSFLSPSEYVIRDAVPRIMDANEKQHQGCDSCAK